MMPGPEYVIMRRVPKRVRAGVTVMVWAYVLSWWDDWYTGKGLFCAYTHDKAEAFRTPNPHAYDGSFAIERETRYDPA